MQFNEITEKVPWDILAEDCRSIGTIGGAQDLRAGQSKTDPKHGLRLFKSHESVEAIAKRKGNEMMARYVIVCRNPEDVFHSFHQFLPAYCGIDPEEIRAGRRLATPYSPELRTAGNTGNGTWIGSSLLRNIQREC